MKSRDPAQPSAAYQPVRPGLLPQAGPRSMALAGWLVVACGLILAFDLGGELAPVQARPALVAPAAWVHLTFEAAASLGLGWAFVLIRREARRARVRAARAASSLAALRGAFDAVMAAKFRAWGLTAAERDVALLVVRGLGIAEISSLRGTAAGTTKAQVHAVLRKSGAASRAELVAQFLDELLDLEAEPAAAPT